MAIPQGVWYSDPMPPKADKPNLRQARKAIKHGAYASKAALRVPERYEADYHQFVSEDKPFDLRRELALLRVLHMRLEEALSNAVGWKIEEVQQALKEKIQKVYGPKTKDVEKLEKMSQTMSTIAAQVIEDTLGIDAVDTESLMDIADHIEKISRVAERMKKIQEGVKLNVNIDNNVLIKFIQEVVFREITDHTTRQRIIERTMRMALPNAPINPAKHTSPREVVTAENADPIGAYMVAEYVENEQGEISLEEELL